ncbi:MAG TPA: type 1 glutamine amidotransferase domain-containing protein [Candidatus Baltobacteraceae bacterium]|jgi:protease I|nr:type 1 glutamine amidotransferase domain-containing protein [Candidatus Baltobacteraceae bacterium]
MTTSNRLEGMNVAILVEDRFEQVELTEPRKALDQAGAKTVVVSPKNDQVQGMNHDDIGERINVDLPLDRARPEDFDALLLPGGVVNPDRLRMNKKAMDFVRSFVQAGKPIAAICHGPWSLVEVDAVRGRRVTSWPSLQTDIRNAGGNWVDEVNVTDQNITTSRKPDDIPKFNEAMLHLFEESRTRGELRQTAKV